MALKADFISSTWVVGFNVMVKFCTIQWYCDKCPPDWDEILLSLVSNFSDKCHVLQLFPLILNLIESMVRSFCINQLFMSAGFNQFPFFQYQYLIALLNG